jgi:predicted solute-binding protein
MLKRWQKRYRSAAGAEAYITDTVAQWFQQALTETVLGVLALRGSEYWDERAVAAALSEEGLSAAVMQRYHLDMTLKRELANKLGQASQIA